LNDQDSRSIEVSTNNKRIEYFPMENMIIKGSGSVTDLLDIAKEDTDIYSDNKNPKVKKVANKIIDYTLGNKKLTGEKLKVKRSKIKHKIIMQGNSKRNREDPIKSELEYSDVSELENKKSSEEKDEDRSLIKKRDIEDDDPKEILPKNNIIIIKNALKY
jgi:hypothetical protein